VSRPDPEVGRSILTGGVRTNYHDAGAGPPVLLLHGSGPGVSAWANWRLLLRDPGAGFRFVAPDLAGFGYTESPGGRDVNRGVWLSQLVDLLDALGIERAGVVGNSFRGSLALGLAIAHPERFR
jgi:2-hydroxymuconate-semialdehyde hydrolase